MNRIDTDRITELEDVMVTLRREAGPEELQQVIAGIRRLGGELRGDPLQLTDGAYTVPAGIPAGARQSIAGDASVALISRRDFLFQSFECGNEHGR